MWGVIWLIQALVFFAGGVIVGLVAFKQSAAQQKEDASHFLPVPHAHSGTVSTANIPNVLIMIAFVIGSTLFGL